MRRTAFGLVGFATLVGASVLPARIRAQVPYYAAYHQTRAAAADPLRPFTPNRGGRGARPTNRPYTQPAPAPPARIAPPPRHFYYANLPAGFGPNRNVGSISHCTPSRVSLYVAGGGGYR